MGLSTANPLNGLPRAGSTITANLVGPPRRVTEGGREFFVAPVTLIVPGILPGSRGPLRYTAEDISENVGQWSGVPLTVRHPFDPLTNEHLSAADDGVWERQGIGEIREAEFNRNLRAEAWVDVERANRIDKRIVKNLENGRPVEVSTGLFTTQAAAPPNANLNGKPYVAFAREHKADHVAVLPDERGACSIADGCGLLVNASSEWNPTRTGPKDDCDDWGGRRAAGLPANHGDDGCSCGGSCKRCKDEAEELSGGEVTGVQGTEWTVTELTSGKRQATANFLRRLDELWVVNEQARDERGRWLAAVNEILQYTKGKTHADYDKAVVEHLYQTGERPRVAAMALVKHAKGKWQLPVANDWSDAARAAALLARQASATARKASNAAKSPAHVGLGRRNFGGDAGKKALASAKLAVETGAAGLAGEHPLGPNTHHRKAAVLHESAAREHETAADSAHKQGHVAVGMLHSQAAQAHKRAAGLHLQAARGVANKLQTTLGFVGRLDQLWVANTRRSAPVGNAQSREPLSGGRWVTTEEGRHIYIKGGQIAAGNPNLIRAVVRKGGGGNVMMGVRGGPGDGSRGGRDAEASAAAGGRVAGKAGGSHSQGTGAGGEGEHSSANQEALARVTERLDRYKKVFERKGEHEAAQWMDMLKDHINEVGVQHALDALGEKRAGDNAGRVQYEGAYDEPGDTKAESDFIRRYLDRAGVSLIHGNTEVNPSLPLVSGWSEKNLKQEGRDRTRREGDYIPTDATFKHKLEETQHLPGLESTADIHDAVGSKVTHFTPEVLKTLDEKFGKGKWIVKSYGDEAYAGFGVMFPERVRQVQRDAKAAVADADSQLRDHGYRVARDEAGVAVGVRQGKEVIHFGDPEFGKLPRAVQTLGKQVRQAAPSEHGTRLPTSPEESLQNNYGVTLRRGKDGVPNGIVDWDGREHRLDGKFAESWGKQDGAAAEHELHRALEADEWRRKGFSTEPKFMVGPAFKAVGVSASDRAAGATWETANEGRVHCITRDGKASVVPYATLAGRGDSMPAVFASKDVRDMEKAVEDAVNKLPASERTGQLYAPDVVRTKDGWRVLELNPAAAGGGSDWLGRNPFVIDAVASHAVGREPMHARFIRRLLGGDKQLSLGRTPPSPPEAADPSRLNPQLGQPNPAAGAVTAVPKRSGGVKGGAIIKNSEDQPRDDHGRWSGGGNAVRRVKLGRSSVRFSERAPKRIDGPNLGLKNYRQHDEHSCSFVAALTVVHHFDGSVTPTDVLKAVRPTKAGGLARKSLRDGLRRLGVNTEYKKDLTVADLKRHVDQGNPVMVTVLPKDWSSDHWTVVSGFSGDRIHLSNHKSMPISQFKDEWFDKGEGLVCRKSPRQDKRQATANFLSRLDQLWVAKRLTTNHRRREVFA